MSTTVQTTGTGSVYIQNLAFTGNSIIATNENGSVNFVPNGTGVIGFGDVGFNNGVISTTLDNLDIVLSPDGNGTVKTGNLQLDGNTISTTDTDGDLLLAPNGNGTVKTGNLQLTGNTISSTDTDGDLLLAPNGNVGIGTSSPRTKLHVGDVVDNSYYSGATGSAMEVYGTASTIAPGYSDGNSTATFFVSSTTDYAQNVGASIGLCGRSYPWGGGVRPHTMYAKISGVQQPGSNNYYGNFVIETMGNNGQMREKFRINGDGNVGIGTTSPVCGLDVQSSGTRCSYPFGIGGNSTYAEYTHTRVDVGNNSSGWSKDFVVGQYQRGGWIRVYSGATKSAGGGMTVQAPQTAEFVYSTYGTNLSWNRVSGSTSISLSSVAYQTIRVTVSGGGSYVWGWVEIWQQGGVAIF